MQRKNLIEKEMGHPKTRKLKRQDSTERTLTLPSSSLKAFSASLGFALKTKLFPFPFADILPSPVIINDYKIVAGIFLISSSLFQTGCIQSCKS